MNRLRAALIVSALACASVPLGIAACSDTAATVGITPITGIIIRSDALVAGVGCGTAPKQVYKYVAAVASNDDVMNGVPSTYLNASIFSCFADGVFSTIPLPASGNPSFTVTIVALDKASYDAQRGALDAIAAKDSQTVSTALVDAVTPTWTTTCHATQQANVAVLAVCDALANRPMMDTDAGDGGGDAEAGSGTRIQIDTASFPRADGGTYSCGTDFTSVRVFFDRFPMDTGSIPCPMPVVISPATPNITYHLDVILEKGGVGVGQAMGCTAMTMTGATTKPTCPAFQ